MAPIAPADFRLLCVSSGKKIRMVVLPPPPTRVGRLPPCASVCCRRAPLHGMCTVYFLVTLLRGAAGRGSRYLGVAPHFGCRRGGGPGGCRVVARRSPARASRGGMARRRVATDVFLGSFFGEFFLAGRLVRRSPSGAPLPFCHQRSGRLPAGGAVRPATGAAVHPRARAPLQRQEWIVTRWPLAAALPHMMNRPLVVMVAVLQWEARAQEISGGKQQRRQCR